MRTTRIGQAGPGGWRRLRIGAAALAAVGVVGAVPPATAAPSAQALDWTKQAPATSPPARSNAMMADDGATGTVVMFGGAPRPVSGKVDLTGDTWTWDGTTWTKQHPAVRPGPRDEASMAYDGATGTVVMFGGFGELGFGRRGLINQTWTWDGTTWTGQHPATKPPARIVASMAYDAATSTVVMFGGETNTAQTTADTWTGDGMTWTQQHPATSPPARNDAVMAYDAATGTAVLFGGFGSTGHALSDTWTWDGTTWTQQHPAASPPGRYGASMAYDAATGTVVLFGGFGSTGHALSDTWTWDGTTWTKQAPAVHPGPRSQASMTYDAATGTAVLFGGLNDDTGRTLGDTWTWG